MKEAIIVCLILFTGASFYLGPILLYDIYNVAPAYCCMCLLATFSLDHYVCLLGLRFYIPVKVYGHVERVSSPNNTFSWASLTKQLTSTLCKYFCL